MKRKNITLDSTEMACRLTSRSSHAERDGEKRSLTEVAVYDFAARC
jgi:tellurite resistance protein